MNPVVLTCPHCNQRSKVAFDAIGFTVACPRCSQPFTADPEPSAPTRQVPVVARRSTIPNVPVVRPSFTQQSNELDEPAPLVHPDFDEHAEPQPAATPNGVVFALAMLPLAIPLLWLAATQLGARRPEFSFALPVAIGLGVSGVCWGLAVTHRWSIRQRIIGVLALVFLACLSGVLLFAVKKEWIEQTRELLGRGEVAWVKYQPNPDDLKGNDLSFEVRIPGQPTPQESPVPGLPLKGAIYSEPDRDWQDQFVIAHGRYVEGGGGWVADEVWFGKVKEIIEKETGGKLISENDRQYQTYAARYYIFQLPENANGPVVRIVRVVRVANAQLFYLSVEGPYLSKDNLIVQKFLDSLRIVPNKAKKK